MSNIFHCKGVSIDELQNIVYIRCLLHAIICKPILCYVGRKSNDNEGIIVYWAISHLIIQSYGNVRRSSVWWFKHDSMYVVRQFGGSSTTQDIASATNAACNVGSNVACFVSHSDRNEQTKRVTVFKLRS